MKEFDAYQLEAKRTCPDSIPLSDQLSIGALGLAGESGEAVDLVKKALHHGHPLDASKLAKELGDVLWYLAVLAAAIGYDLSAVAEMNVSKLRARYPDGFSKDASRNRKDGDV